MPILPEGILNSFDPESKGLKAIQILAMAIPPIVYFVFVYHYALNIPRQDDYDAILGFLNDFQKGGLQEKMALLFSQHNEHRILFSRLIFVLCFKLTGAFNFRTVIFINYAILSLIYLLFISFSRKLLPHMWRVSALVAGMCLYNLNGWENSDFAMAGTQNFGVILLFMAGIFCYNKRDLKWIPLAIVLQAICVFSSGNGNVAVLFIVLFTVLNKYKPAMVASVITMLLISPLYYYHYAKPGGGFMSLNPTKFIPYLVHVTGNHFGRDLSLLAGFGILISGIWLLPTERKLTFKDGALPFVCIAAFAFCSVGVLSVFRAGLPMETAYSSRYIVYSDILTVILALLVLLKMEGKKLRHWTTAAVVLCLAVVYIRGIRGGKEGFNFIRDNIVNNTYDYPDKARAKDITDESCKLGIYCIEDARRIIK